MPTVIDSLVITLGLDTSDYQKKQKEAAGQFQKTKEAAVKGAKDIESASQGAASALHKVALEALSLFAVFTGASSLKNFVTDLISADAALGRFAARIDESPQKIDAWGKAAERVGGSADATAASFQKIADALNELHTNGKALPQAYYRLMADSGVRIDTEHGPAAFMEGVAKAVNKLSQTDPSKATFYAQGMGIDAGTISLMQQYGGAIDKYVGGIMGLAPTNEQIKASQQLQEAWAKFQQTLVSLGQTVLPTLNDVLGPALDSWSKWVLANRDLINTKVNEIIEAVANALKSIDWAAITKGMGDFATAADQVASAVTAIADAIKTLLSYNDSFNAFMQKVQNPFGLKQGENIFQHFKGAAPEGAPLPATKNNPSSVHRFPGRAVGGSTSPGRSYLVGERGPEILNMGGVGAVTPNGSFGGDISVDGRSVNKSNPVPVELTGGQGGGENWLQTLGRWLGGGTSGGGGGGIMGAVGGAVKGIIGAVTGTEVAQPDGATGQYRPVYKLGAADTSNKVISKIAGEATSSQTSIDAVINNMFNRLGTHTYGPSGNLEQVAMAPGQYAASAYKNVSPKLAALIRARIQAVASGQVPDNTHGSNEYRAGWYNGPWGRAHANSPVIGGNRFAYNPRGGRGPYAAYDKPHEAFAGGAAFSAAVKNAQTTNNSTSSSNQVHIANVNIHTQAKDGPGVAAALGDAIKRTQYASAANTGLK
jgi:hypothetical protein